MVTYADTSALVRAYFEDEPDHALLRKKLRESFASVVTSELARVEFVSAATAAARAGRIRRPEAFIERFKADCAFEGPLNLLALEPDTCLSLARQLVAEHRLRTLDAIHLAVALTTAKEIARTDPVIFVTRDQDQAVAAEALGLIVE